MNLQIRRSTPDDAEKILALQAIALRGLSPSYSPQQLESLIWSQASIRFTQDEINIVAEYENILVGFASLLMDSSQVSGVYVDPKFVRRGIGSQLLGSIEEIATNEGLQRIQVIASLDAVSFYQKNGYGIDRPSGFRLENGTWIPCMKLEKRLIPASRARSLYRRGGSWVTSLKPVVMFMGLMGVGLLIMILLPLIFSLLASLLR